MDTYLPGRHELLETVFTAAEGMTGQPPSTVLDVGGGAGATLRPLLDRWPATDVTLLDLDPVLLALAEATWPVAEAGRPRLVRADLGVDHWIELAGGPYDVVLVFLVLHYFPPERVRRLYAELREVLRPDGLLVVADAMPSVADAVPVDPSAVVGRPSVPGHDPWSAWWADLATDPELRELLAERAAEFAGMIPAEFTAPVRWHRQVARESGFGGCRVLWQNGVHTALGLRR